MSKKTATIYCRCAYYQIIPDSVKNKVLDAIKNAGIDFVAVPNLYKASAEREGAFRQLYVCQESGLCDALDHQVSYVEGLEEENQNAKLVPSTSSGQALSEAEECKIYKRRPEWRSKKG